MGVGVRLERGLETRRAAWRSMVSLVVYIPGLVERERAFANRGCVDSTMGKLMEKTGKMMHNENLVAKGAEKRETERMLGEKHGENEAN
jgi:hypothetical protein